MAKWDWVVLAKMAIEKQVLRDLHASDEALAHTLFPNELSDLGKQVLADGFSLPVLWRLATRTGSELVRVTALLYYIHHDMARNPTQLRSSFIKTLTQTLALVLLFPAEPLQE